MAKRVVIDGNSLTIEKVHRVACDGAKVVLSSGAKRAVRQCRKWYDTLIRRGECASGAAVQRGDGGECTQPAGSERELETRVIHAHIAGTGSHCPEEVVRASILCRVNTFARGYGGAGPELVDTLVELLNRGITPLMHEKGPVGTTGSMAQVAEVLMGSGEAYYRDELLPSALALKKAGLDSITLNHMEGLNLINGTHVMTGGLALSCYDARNLLRNAMVASAMTIDVLRISRGVLAPLIHELRPHPGQGAVAENIKRMADQSTIGERETGGVPDAFSLQCSPQILGPSLDALTYVNRQAQIEMNAVTDEHLFFAGDKTCPSGGHAHGQPIAMAADFLAIAMAEVASLSERHINRLLNPALSGLPGFLVEGEGLITGLASAQQTAAALVSEHKILTHPGVVDSISISADREDHLSMGPLSVGKLRRIISNTATVIAIEMLCAAQAIDFRKPLRPGRGTRAAHRTIRSVVSHLDNDRPLYPDIQKVTQLVEDGSVIRAVERAVGPIGLGDMQR